MNFAIVDIETTGLSGADNRVTEIAIILHDGHKVQEEFHTLVNPGVPVSPYVTGLTGIDDQMVADAPAFEALAEQLLELMENRVFVAHNVQFDFQVLRSEFKRSGYEFYRKKLCTVRWSRKVFPGLGSYSLGKLCSSLDIPLTDRHRAKGDADATVLLFEKLLACDREEVFMEMISRNAGTGVLPALLPREEFEKLPEAPGIYYFKDQYGKIIYVGKAINIKKRVLGHFYDKKPRETALCRETASLDFELSGSELLALLMESKEIKKHYPKYNRAQKNTNKGYALTTYVNRKGILQLGYNPSRLVSGALGTFFSVHECIAELERLCLKYQLCPRYTQLQVHSGPCDHYRIRSCRGICRDREEVEAYNERVRQAIEELTMSGESFVLLLNGREQGEKGFFMVENGVYKGYGFLDENQAIGHWEEFSRYLLPAEHNRDVIRLIAMHLRKYPAGNFRYPESASGRL